MPPPGSLPPSIALPLTTFRLSSLSAFLFSPPTPPLDPLVYSFGQEWAAPGPAGDIYPFPPPAALPLLTSAAELHSAKARKWTVVVDSAEEPLEKWVKAQKERDEKLAATAQAEKERKKKEDEEEEEEEEEVRRGAHGSWNPFLLSLPVSSFFLSVDFFLRRV